MSLFTLKFKLTLNVIKIQFPGCTSTSHMLSSHRSLPYWTASLNSPITSESSTAHCWFRERWLEQWGLRREKRNSKGVWKYLPKFKTFQNLLIIIRQSLLSACLQWDRLDNRDWLSHCFLDSVNIYWTAVNPENVLETRIKWSTKLAFCLLLVEEVDINQEWHKQI